MSKWTNGVQLVKRRSVCPVLSSFVLKQLLSIFASKPNGTTDVCVMYRMSGSRRVCLKVGLRLLMEGTDGASNRRAAIQNFRMCTTLYRGVEE